mgnify:FL=1
MELIKKKGYDILSGTIIDPLRIGSFRHPIFERYGRLIHFFVIEFFEAQSNGSVSTKREILTEVPQSSVLGPLPFIAIINDLTAFKHVIYSPRIAS